MPYVRGFLKFGRPSKPGLPGSGGEPTHPIELPGDGEEIDEIPGEPAHPIVIPDPPPGIWPPPTISHPIVPVPPGTSPEPPPGEIYPPIEGAPKSKFFVLAYIPGYGVKYVVVDPSLKPTPK